MSRSRARGGPVRVLHLRDSPWIDGPGRTILETASRIDRSRIEYHVGAFVTDPSAPHPLIDALRSRGSPVHAIADRAGVGRPLVDRVTSILQQLQIDVLHTSELRSNVLGLLCRRRHSVKLVSTAHGWIANDLRGYTKTIADLLTLRSFDRVILVSHAMRQRVPRWWVPDSRVRVLRNALMIESYGRKEVDMPRAVPDPRGSIRILNVGRLSAEKGQLLLLRAMALLTREFPRLTLAFAGVGPMEVQLKSLAVELGIDSRVDFLGYVPDMPALYATSDLVVQSSYTEGLPNVMLEVAYLGVPVVATDVGGTAEVIEHGISGWLIEPRSLKALEQGLRKFLDHPAHFVAMARAGRLRVTREFSFSERTEAQTRIYEELV